MTIDFLIIIQGIAMKKYFKKIVSLLLITILSFGTCLNTFAAESSSLSGTVNVNSKHVTVSDVMTFDEMIAEVAKDNNASVESTKQLYYKTHSNTYGLKSTITPYANTYRTITISLPVTGVYKPQLKVYCRTSEGGTMWGIYEILNVNMNRVYNNLTKQFDGSVYVNLEDASTIYWTVDGDFYNTGTTTVSLNGNVNIPIGAGATITFGVSLASNHFATYWDEDRWSI